MLVGQTDVHGIGQVQTLINTNVGVVRCDSIVCVLADRGQDIKPENQLDRLDSDGLFD